MWPFRRRVELPLGAQCEELAARYLRRHGYKILERNVKAGRNELDIVAREGDTIAFVEVRSRSAEDGCLPEDTINREKQRRIRAAAHVYIKNHPAPEMYYRYDVVAITLNEGAKPDIRLYRDAFSDDV